MHCEPWRSAHSVIRSGPGAEQIAHVGLVGDAPADGQRHVDAGTGAGHLLEQLVPRLVTGGDVEPAQLVGALLGVAQGGFDRLAAVAQVDELDALDDAAARDIKTGDDATAQHQRPSQARKRRRSWRPASAERSGWNCAPATDPRATTEAIEASSMRVIASADGMSAVTA